MSTTRTQEDGPEREYNTVIFSPFVRLIERYARKRRNTVVYKRAMKRDRYNTGPMMEIKNGDGSITRVIAVEPIPPEN